MQKNISGAQAWNRPRRPRELSNPYCEFLDECVAELLAMSDEDLGGEEFSDLFSPVSMGSFEETAYYLPLAFRFMQEKGEGSGDCIVGFAFWLSHHAEALGKLGADKYVVAELGLVLQSWTSEFNVRHYDEAACRAKGWVLRYDDNVENSEDLAQLVHCLVEEGVFARVAEGFVATLAESASPLAAAWFLEFTRWQEEGLFDCVTGGEMPVPDIETERQLLLETSRAYGAGVYEAEFEAYLAAPRDTKFVKSDAILRLIRDESLLTRARDKVASGTLFDPAATYWRDTLHFLGLSV